MIQFLIKVINLNIGLSYELSERDRLCIRGLIPPAILTIEE